MKAKKLQFYSGKISELATTATAYQTSVGIDNKINTAEPFVITYADDITNLGIATKPNIRFAIGNTGNVTTKAGMHEYPTLAEMNTAIGYKYLTQDTSTQTLLKESPLHIIWDPSPVPTQAKLLNLPNMADGLPYGLFRRFVITNRNAPPVLGTGNGSAGNGQTGNLIVQDSSGAISTIPPGQTRTFISRLDSTWSVDTIDNSKEVVFNVTTASSNYYLNADFGYRYTIVMNPSSASQSCSLLPHASMTYQKNILFSGIVRNINATNALSLLLPTGSDAYRSASTFSISASKEREFSVYYGSDNKYHWQISEELSNA